jgi:molybdenum cofactor cytidylyltransferase
VILVRLSGFVSCLGLRDNELVAVYGAGGKSTLLAGLARELVALKKRVILTTTTKIYLPGDDTPVIACGDINKTLDAVKAALEKHPMVVVGASVLPGGKLQGIPGGMVEVLHKSSLAHHILVEADGAAGRPVKGYAAHEPALPSAATLIVPVLGLDALGLTLKNEAAHRPELLSSQVCAAPGDRLNERHLVNCLRYMITLGRPQAPRARVIPVLNKTDMAGSACVGAVAEGLKGLPLVERLLFASAQELEPVKFIFQRREEVFLPRVTCVVLAAGSSRRMGADKLAIKIGDRTILEHTVNNVLASAVDEVILVTQPDSWAAGLFPPEKVKVVINSDHLQGQSTSLRAGLAAAAESTQAVLFALADQPFIPPAVYTALVEQYRHSLKPAVYPEYQGQRGNPVLFDRRIFPMLQKLQGDTGGRAIITHLSQNQTSAVPVSTSTILTDIDTPADLRVRNGDGPHFSF